MNKKYIIGFLITGVLIAGGVYLYIRNKNKDVVTRRDALKVFDYANNRDAKLSRGQKQAFVDLYKLKINKVLSDKILLAIEKNESERNAEDNANLVTLYQDVVLPYVQLLPKI